MLHTLDHFSEKELLEFTTQFKGIFFNNQLFITEELELIDGFFIYPVRMDIYMLMICIQGSFQVSVNLRDFTVKEGMAMVYAPDYILQIRQHHNAVIKAVAITGSFLNEIRVDLNKIFTPLINCNEKPTWQLTENELKIIDNYLRLIHSVFILPEETYKKEMIRGLISSVIYLFADVWQRESKTAKNKEAPGAGGRTARHFARFMELLHQYHCTEHNVGFYADQMCVTPKYLSSLIKNHSGKSVVGWIDEYLVLEAKNLLKFSDKSIKEISNELSFSDPSFLCKYFKKQTGMTPTEYKKM